MDKQKIEKFIQENSPDGGFLQSEEWRKFQENVGKKTFNIFNDAFWANIIEHKLPIVGKYLYISRGPVLKTKINKKEIENALEKLLKLAKKNKAGWIRFEPCNNKILKNIKNSIKFNIVKAPHDMQSRQIFIVDISKNEEELLTEMKSKTRYNIRLAKRKGVVYNSYNFSDEKFGKKFDKFLELVEKTASRKGVKFHQKNYYWKMVESIPEKNLKLYVAEYQGKIITANLILFFGNTATYLHGASADEYKNVMAPFLLQWQIILEVKKNGFTRYDFGGVKTENKKGELMISETKWRGISKFKLGFSKITKPFEFPGSYDIIVNKKKYFAYKLLQKLKF